MRDRLTEMLASVPDPKRDLEPWDARGRYAERWHELLPELRARVEEANRANVFDIALLAERLATAAQWLLQKAGVLTTRTVSFRTRKVVPSVYPTRSATSSTLALLVFKRCTARSTRKRWK